MTRKIFFIGFNKTGTMTYNAIFVSNGFNGYHLTKWASLSNTADYESLDNLIKKYDVFTDGERPNYKRLDKIYPGSLFILNTRNLKKWLQSRIKHVFREYPDDAKCWMWCQYIANPNECIKKWITQRLDYHYEVREYFKNRPNDFLEIDIDDPDKIDKLSNFIGEKLIWNEQIINSRQVNERGPEYRKLILKEFKRIDRILS